MRFGAHLQQLAAADQLARQRRAGAGTGCSNNGNPYARLAHDDATDNIYLFYGTKFNTFEAVVGWDYDTRNRTLFADRGMRHSLSCSITCRAATWSTTSPTTQYLKYVPLWQALHAVLLRRASTTGRPSATRPPSRRTAKFFAGGPDIGARLPREPPGPEGPVRQSLRRQPAHRQPERADLPDAGEVARRPPASAPSSTSATSSRPAATSQVHGPNGSYRQSTTSVHGFSTACKRSVGMAVQWLAPLGLFRFSYGIPLNAKQRQPAIRPGGTRPKASSSRWASRSKRPELAKKRAGEGAFYAILEVWAGPEGVRPLTQSITYEGR